MSLSKKQRTFTKNIGKLIEFAFNNGYEFTFGEVYRTKEQQEIYFKSGRSKTMNSRHLDRLAVDFNIFKNDLLLFQNPDTRENEIAACLVLGDYWLSLDLDNCWGGDWNRNHKTIDESFKDPYHFEMKP